MKNLLVAIFLTSSSFVLLHAALPLQKFDIASRSAFAGLRTNKEAKAANNNSIVTAFVSIEGGSDPSFLKTYGLEYRIVASDVAIARGTMRQLIETASDTRTVSVSLSRSLEHSNNICRAAIGADRITTEPGIDGSTYTGKGVITGIFDAGFDLQNPSFRRDDQSRVKRMWHYTDENGGYTEYFTPELINIITTDDADNHHGSHVLGTMSGCNPEFSTYNGIAIDADIAIACGPLYDTNIADGVARIAAYARKEGKPCVINLSISDYVGPRDGTDPFCQALADATSLSGDAILVLSAGNYNTSGTSLSRIFTPTNPNVRTFIVPELWKKSDSGVLSIWSGDNRPLKLKIVIVDTHNGEDILAEFDVPADPQQPLFVSSSILNENYGIEFINNPAFDRAYNNSLVAVYYGENESTNGRPNFYIEYILNINTEQNSDSRIALGVIVEGSDGQRVDINLMASNSELRSLWVDGWCDGANELSISSMAAADGAVCVGAWVSRPTWFDISGTEQRMYGDDVYVLGDIAPWSSRGTLVDGRTLPHTAAPGAAVISVLSTPYYTIHPERFTIVEQQTFNGRTNYWDADYGTSMSSPAVAGSIALWLEADPSLTAADVLDIIAETSGKDSFVTKEHIAWGAGKFDAEAGLREVLNRRSALAGPSAIETPGLQVKHLQHNSLEVNIYGADSFTAEMYDISGRLVASAYGSDGTAIISVENLRKGVYVVRAGRHFLKIAL